MYLNMIQKSQPLINPAVRVQNVFIVTSKMIRSQTLLRIFKTMRGFGLTQLIEYHDGSRLSSSGRYTYFVNQQVAAHALAKFVRHLEYVAFPVMLQQHGR